MINLAKIRNTLVYTFFVSVLFLGVHPVLALSPTKNISVLDTIEPLVHSGAGVQSILGPLLIGSAYQILPGQYTIQVLANRTVEGNLIANPRPAIFTKSKASGVTNSFFTVLQNSIFGKKVFIGFGRETFVQKAVDTVPTTTEWESIKQASPSLPLTPERLTVRGNILATNLNGSSGNVTGQNNVCVNANGTLVLCQPKNPVIDFRFDECTYAGTNGEVVDAQATVVDARSNAGTLQTASLGRVGRSLNFTGTSGEYIISSTTAADIASGEQMSIATWFRSSASAGDGVNWIAWKESNCLGWYIQTTPSGNVKTNLKIGTNCSSYTNWQITSPVAVMDGSWHHVVFSIDRINNVMTQYIDGQPEGTVVISGSGASAGGGLRIGTNADATGLFRDGSIDEFKVYDTILTSVDVRELYLTEKAKVRSISCS